jgi:manganese/iron transport system permease protein
MGDALSHAVVPGVAIAYLVGAPFALGAFVSGMLAALAILAVRRITALREDVVIGVVFTGLFALGLAIASLNPTSVRLQSIVFGNVLAISDVDMWQVLAVSAVTLAVLALRWRDLMLVFFDEAQARTVGLSPRGLYVLFFVLLSAATVAALQTVGALLVIALLVTPGATAYLLTDRFGIMIAIALALGAASGAIGAYASFFLDGATGGLVVLVQTSAFVLAYLFAPKHGRLRAWRRSKGLALP